MKTKKYTISKLILLTLVVVVPLAACSTAAPNSPDIQSTKEYIQSEPAVEIISEPAADAVEVSYLQDSSVDVEPNLAFLGEPGEEEIGGLTFMREEEKLARDVYLFMYNNWGLAIFQNIANSEQSHMDAVLRLLNTYGIEDPAAAKAPGEFTNNDLQNLYNQLVTQGSQSLSDALKVGAAIEEIDILDLEERLEKTHNPDIVMVYENLMRGSYNHLRSFTSTLYQQNGEVYAPQYLSAELYQSIIGTGINSGGNGKGNGKANRP